MSLWAAAIRNRAVYLAVLAGLVYGLFCRIALTFKWHDDIVGLISLGFLVVMPAGMGFISAFIAKRGGQRGVETWLVLPVLTTLALTLSSYLLFWEGLICITMALPLAMVMSVVGGLAGMVCGRRFGKAPVLCVAVLPFIVAGGEQWAGPKYEAREVASAVVIHASPAAVWEQIKRVPAIRPEEQRFSWTQKIGFPRPIEATLSRDGVGGVRHATFAGGVLFVETVTEWEPNQRLGFDIRADTASIPPTTLDEHVTIGGRYFDALHGEYRIEPLADGGVVMHLVSRHRLSTTMNAYAGIWTDAVMRDIQENILYVIRGRCEAGR